MFPPNLLRLSPLINLIKLPKSSTLLTCALPGSIPGLAASWTIPAKRDQPANAQSVM